MNKKQGPTSGATLDAALEIYKRIEGQKRSEMERMKLSMTRQNYDRTRSSAQKARDIRRLEKIMKSLAEVSDLRQQAEALLLARAQNQQGVGLIEAALARKSKVEEEHA